MLNFNLLEGPFPDLVSSKVRAQETPKAETKHGTVPPPRPSSASQRLHGPHSRNIPVPSCVCPIMTAPFIATALLCNVRLLGLLSVYISGVKLRCVKLSDKV